MRENKSPGNDGLTVEFYKHFWPLVSKLVMDSFNTAIEVQNVGEFSVSQKQSIVTLIEEPGQDRQLLKNWRPIS